MGAPFSGVVTKRYADTGALIQAGTASDTQSLPVVRLAEWTKLRLVVPIPESAVPQIHLGSAVQVRVPSPGYAEGKLLASRTSIKRAHLPWPRVYRIGMEHDGRDVETDLVLKQTNGALTVPIQAIDRNGSGGASVLLVDKRLPVDLFPNINIPVVVVATFYSGMPPEQIENSITGRFERFFTLASGIDHIESRSLPGRQSDQNLLSARQQPRHGGEHHRQPGHGQPAPAAAGNVAAGGAEVRRLEPAGVPDHAQRRRLERDGTAGHRPVCGAQSSGQCARSQRAAAIRGQVSADHGVCGPVEAGGQPTLGDGRGAGGERLEPDSAGGRRADRPVQLQHLCEQPVARRGGRESAAAQDRGPVVGAGRGRGRSERCGANPGQRRAGGRPALGLPPRPQTGRQHDCGGQRHQERRWRTCSTYRPNWWRRWSSISPCL